MGKSIRKRSVVKKNATGLISSKMNPEKKATRGSFSMGKRRRKSGKVRQEKKGPRLNSTDNLWFCSDEGGGRLKTALVKGEGWVKGQEKRRRSAFASE